MEQPKAENDQEQFEIELEFVLCLANPEYLNCTDAPVRHFSSCTNAA